MLNNDLANETFTDQKRHQAKSDAQAESRKADQKQHADKLLQGFAKIDDNAPNRAIWELVQNACDLANNCKVTIDYRNGGFAFSHNGKPFTPKTLLALIKQVSSKGEAVSEEVGRFGTGFITTHAFGRKFKIDSLLRVDEQLIQLEEFLVDRTPMDWEAMVNELEKQEQKLYEVIENGQVVETGDIRTTLTYLPESDIERRYIQNSHEALHAYIPIVLAINERLVSVTVNSADGSEKTYSKEMKHERRGLWVTPIRTDDGLREVFSLKDEEVEVVLPLKTENEAFVFGDKVAKLFLYYPLIGTEKWGCNFVIHSKLFKPTEPRDGIHLQSNNEQVHKDEEINRGLIERASEIIFRFVKERAETILNPTFLAFIEFNANGDKPLLNEYFKNLMAKWVNWFKECSLVETETGKCAPSGAVFLSAELLQDDDKIDSIYQIAEKFWQKLPKMAIVKDWTSIIEKWIGANPSYRTASDLALKLQESGKLDIFENKEALHKVYQYFINYGFGDLFNRYKLLPNIDGEFRLLTTLNSKVNLNPELIEIARVLAPEVPGKHIMETFKFSFELTPYKRSDYSKDITDQVNKFVREGSSSKAVAPGFFAKLLDFCRIATSADSNSAPSRVVKLISSYYGHAPELMPIPIADGEEVDNRTAQRKLLQVFLTDVAAQDATWVQGNISALDEMITILKGFREYADLLQTACIFPNKLNELCLQSGLKIDRNIPTELKEMYDRICRPKLPIDATLVHPRFEQHLSQQEGRTAKNLGSEIEAIFSEDGSYHNINNHPYQADIIRIIELITSDSSWAEYFMRLDQRKANIMLERVSGRTRGAMFKIMNLPPDKVEMISKLADQPNLEALLALSANATEQVKAILTTVAQLPESQIATINELIQGGQLNEVLQRGLEALEEDRRTKADFEFKHQIGKKIEQLVQDKVGKDLSHYGLEVYNVQDGQDIIIKKGEIELFFIEVKSRWKTDSSVMMSRNQFLKAADNKDKHSLCCVEMSDYRKGEPDRYNVQDINLILDRIKFVNKVGSELDPLVRGIFKSTDTENDITLTGDYKATIPQRLIKEGITLDNFVNDLITHLKLK